VCGNSFCPSTRDVLAPVVAALFKGVTGRGYRDGRDLDRASDGWRVVAAEGSAWPTRVARTGRGARRSGRAFVSMMKPTDLWDRHDGAIAGRHDRTRNRRVLVQRQVSAGPFVVRTVAGHQPQQACLIDTIT
jgi:hypothetical protein